MHSASITNTQTHTELAGFIWSICNLLRGPYKRNEYRKVILPLTVLRRFDCLLSGSKAATLEAHASIKHKPESVIRNVLEQTTGYPFYNLSKLELIPTTKGKNSPRDAVTDTHLTDLLRAGGSVHMEALWQESGLDFAAFFAQLKTEAERGLITETKDLERGLTLLSAVGQG